MEFIAHRGLMQGPDRQLENNPTQIQRALDQGFSCEIDLWVSESRLFLGHDEPQYIVDEKYLDNKKFWIHAKNLAALKYLTERSRLVYFWHQNDDYTLTSNGYIWTYPGKPLTDKSIMVMPEWTTKNFAALDNNCFGVCSDYILEIKKYIFQFNCDRNL